ncbi:hypothetical protein os4_20990 [Comamonadaceae bacterium OS-4]|nr:hypothetical protein os4_20990 [Comamonadaceae bacterium OS-4]
MRGVRLFFRFCAALLCVVALGSAYAHDALVAGQPGSFVFTPEGYFEGKPLTVHYYKAMRAGPDAKVLIAIHGAERNAKYARDNWLGFAEQHGLVVLAPEFDQARFSTRLFNMANLEDGDRGHWSFQLVEGLFESVRVSEHLNAQTYMLFGHSAGAQFVHRFMELTDKPKVSIAVAANAGSYTLPVYPGPWDDGFPYALNEKVVTPDQLRQVFARKLVVLLGEEDTHTDAANLPAARQAKAQGANRWERGHTFFERATAQARKLDTPFAWQLRTVPGVGHNSRSMSKAAAALLLSESH